MTVAIKKQLDESLRDALLALYLNKVVPADATTKTLKLKTAQDLYEYWLLDVLVSQDVPTTPVACAIASLQQYINRILLNMEPGYDAATITDEHVQTWRNEMHQYPSWAAHQKLLYFPAIYLAPGLRNNKSDNFRQLENDLSQNRIQPDAVQTAVLAYLTRFEEVANLNILNGYIDGEDFANSTYHFIAKSRSENTYFWRSLNMAQRPFAGTSTSDISPKQDQPDPYAWSDWEKADVPIPDDAVEHSIRPVWFNNRLFVIWAECVHQDPAAVSPVSSKAGDSQQNQSNPLLRLNLSYKKHDGSWSTPRTCLQGYSDDEALRGKDLNSIKPLIDTLAVNHQKGSRDSLFVALYAHEANTAPEHNYAFLQTACIDKNFTVQPGISSATKQSEKTPYRKTFEDTLQSLEIGNRSNSTQPKFQSKISFPPTLETLANTENTNTAIWNFNGYQSRINADSSYEQTTSTLTLRSTIKYNFEPLGVVVTPETMLFKIYSLPGFHPDLELTLRLPAKSLPEALYVKLGHSSIVIEPSTLRVDRTYTLSFGEPVNLSNILKDSETSPGFTLNSTNDISGKLISTAALKHLIETHTSRNDNFSHKKLPNIQINEVNSTTSFNFKQISIDYKERLYAQHIIFRKNSISETIKADYSNLTVIAKSDPQELLTGDFSHTWNSEVLGEAEEVFYYGVAWTRPAEPEKTLYSALKTIKLKFLPLSTPRQPPSIASNVTTQTLDFSSSDIKLSDNSLTSRHPIRLNTVFTGELIRRTENSLDELFSWETQHLPEPPISGNTTSRMDFHGPYGRYFTELFLYLPWLIAHRLNAEHQYDEAERWIQYVFNPGRKQDNNQPAYWGAAPLTGPDVPSYSNQAPHDPHQIALSHPVHFRKALYFLYLDILINRGDAAYRELTPDSLSEAKLWYVRTLDLLGPRQEVQRVDQWSAISLQELSKTTSKSLRTFERSLDSSSLLMREGNPQTSLPAIDTPYLHLPFNPELLKRWDIAERRLHNLRHNLDIAGKPLHLPLFAAPLDPRALLSANALNALGDGASKLPSTQIPHYRFTVMHSQALSAVESVSQFGATLLSLIERKEQAQLQELQQQQAWDLAKISVDLQTQALRIDRQNRQALLASKAIAQGRLSHYQQLLEKDVSEAEAQASQLYLSSGSSELAASASQVVAGGMMMAPNIFGFSNGGSRWEGGMHAATALAQGAAITTRTAAGHLDRTAQFSRRREEWTLTRDQAQLELAQIDAQLAHFTEQETATRLHLRQAETALSQTKASYDFLSKRFTKAQLYQWLNSQFATLYYQAYDATLALCLAAEACWQYERADFSTRFVQPGAWNTTYRGLGAGEQLKLSLLKMQAEYLQRNERELEIRKTVSLRQLKERDKTSTVNKDWADIHSMLISGSCDFELTHAMFEDDYKDQKHYLRRIKTISVSLPAILGPYENIRATLTQTASKVFLSSGDKGPTLENKRASQQIALSTGVDDNGLFTLNFNDERYLPFEYTGAISTWRLTFPNHKAQEAMLESLTDIIVHLSYTARVGGVQ